MIELYSLPAAVYVLTLFVLIFGFALGRMSKRRPVVYANPRDSKGHFMKPVARKGFVG